VTAVLDASALLAYLQGEKGEQRVAVAIGTGCCISSANLAEVLTKRADAGDDPRELARLLASGGLVGDGDQSRSVDLDYEDAIEMAALRAVTRSAGLSLGDRACLALALRGRWDVLTADAVWATIPLEIKVEVIR
jgi:ribonuclease VapC